MIRSSTREEKNIRRKETDEKRNSICRTYKRSSPVPDFISRAVAHLDVSSSPSHNCHNFLHFLALLYHAARSFFSFFLRFATPYPPYPRPPQRKTLEINYRAASKIDKIFPKWNILAILGKTSMAIILSRSDLKFNRRPE